MENQNNSVASDLRIVSYKWRSGVKKETGKAWLGLEIEIQGSEKFTVTKILFLNDTQYEMLGLAKPAKA